MTQPLTAQDFLPNVPLSPQMALERLVEGNRRYAAGESDHAHRDSAQRAAVANEQHPFAIIVSCADSRVPPEILFDQGLGDLFVVRVAGHVVDPVVLGSVEFAAQNLGVPLVVVLGHQRCGAVKAAIAGEHPDGHMDALMRRIHPAIKAASHQEGDLLDNAVNANIVQSVRQLMHSDLILRRVATDNQLMVVGARYNLDDGMVALLPTQTH
jgi:carbonic anhydrase